MKLLNLSIFLKASIAFVCLISCGTTNPVVEPTVVLPADIYTFTSLLDIGNNNNASDIRAEVKFLPTATVSDIVEARFVLVKSSKTFAESQIKDLKTGNYWAIPTANTPVQVIKPANTLKDADGDLVVNGTTYNAYIAVVGKGNTTQLSKSKAVLLSNKAIYIGKYVGIWEELGPPGPGKYPMSLIIKEDYTGQMFYATENFIPYGRGGTTEDAKIVLTVSGSTFTFKLNQFIGQYIGLGKFGANGGCPSIADLKGTINDDINLVFNTFNWADCDGTRDVKLSFKRTE